MMNIAPRTHAAILKDRVTSKKRIVFYFTATGNFLFIAKQFSDAPLSIPQELKKSDENMSTIIGDVSGHKDFVAPSDMGWFTKEMLQGMQEMHFSQRSKQTIRMYRQIC